MIGLESVIESNALESATMFPDDSGERTLQGLPDDSGEFSTDTFEGQDETYASTFEERIGQIPVEGGERGDWTGERGDSVFEPTPPQDIIETLGEYGIDGIEYEDAIPDFSPCSEATVEIENMTDRRMGSGGNYEQCDTQCAEQWSQEGRDGRSEWSPRDVADWRRENDHSWHECNDQKTCQLVPTEVNSYFGHLGGVGEYKRQNATEVSFDE